MTFLLIKYPITRLVTCIFSHSQSPDYVTEPYQHKINNGTFLFCIKKSGDVTRSYFKTLITK